MLLGFFWGEERSRDAKGRFVKKTVVGMFDNIPEQTEDGVRVGRVESTEVIEITAAAPRVIRDRRETPAVAGPKRKRRKG